MNRKVFYRPPPLPQPNPAKKNKPRPEWNMEFGDPNKYKLSQVEMIEKKASLQSRNLNEAREELAERRRKLEEGIIDEETRKIHETALLSKRIDPNPSIRRNLSQMINYERDMLTESRRSTSKRKSVDGPSVEEQLKNTQEFIRRMERASKAKDVIRAVEILEDKSKTSLKGSKVSEPVVTNPVKQKQLTPLQSIGKTLEFMESKLFKCKPQESKCPNITIEPPTTEEKTVFSHQTLQTLGSPILERHEEQLASPIYMEISRIHEPPRSSPTKEEEEEDRWISTIQRMNNLIDRKEEEVGIKPQSKTLFEKRAQPDISASRYERLERFENTSRSQRFLTAEQAYSSTSNLHISPSPVHNENINTLNLQTEQEVEFSLTIDGDNSFRLDTDQFFQQPKSETIINKQAAPTMLKQKVTVERTAVERRVLVQQLDPEEDDRNYATPSDVSFQEVKFTNEVVRAMGGRKPEQPSSSKKNIEAQRIKQLLEDTKRNLDKLPVAPLQVPTSSCSQPHGISLKRLVG